MAHRPLSVLVARDRAAPQVATSGGRRAPVLGCPRAVYPARRRRSTCRSRCCASRHNACFRRVLDSRARPRQHARVLGAPPPSAGACEADDRGGPLVGGADTDWRGDPPRRPPVPARTSGRSDRTHPGHADASHRVALPAPQQPTCGSRQAEHHAHTAHRRARLASSRARRDASRALASWSGTAAPEP